MSRLELIPRWILYPPFLFWLFPSLAWAEGAEEVVRDSLRATQELVYQGRCLVVAWTGSEIEAVWMKDLRTADGKRVREYLPPSRRAPEAFLDDGHALWQLSQQMARLLERRVQPTTLLQKRFQLLQKNYDLRIEGPAGMIAQRPVVAVTARPKDRRKHWQKLWIDRTNSFVLQIERYRADGLLASLCTFREIQFEPGLSASVPPNLPPRLRSLPPPDDLRLVTLAELRATLGPQVALPASLPFGYEFDHAWQHTSDRAWQAHLRYTDGLDTLSLFARKPAPLRDWSALERQHQLAKANNRPVWFARHGPFYIISWQVGDVEQSLVSSLPEAALVQLVEALVPAHREGPDPIRPAVWFPLTLSLSGAGIVFVGLRRWWLKRFF